MRRINTEERGDVILELQAGRRARRWAPEMLVKIASELWL